MTPFALTLVAGAALLAGITQPAVAQLGRQQKLLEPNVTHDSLMLRLPHLTPVLVTTLREARPILGPIPLNSILTAGSLTPKQRDDLYRLMFVHVDVNRGSDAELMLIPGMTAAKVGTIKAGRPWKSFDGFRTELAKSGGAEEAARIEQYLFIPVELNTFTDDIMDTFAGIGVGSRRWKHEFAEYRPWKSMEQFDREIGKYVRGNPKELQRLKRYVIIVP
jgi:hypothetical protein